MIFTDLELKVTETPYLLLPYVDHYYIYLVLGFPFCLTLMFSISGNFLLHH